MTSSCVNIIDTCEGSYYSENMRTRAQALRRIKKVVVANAETYFTYRYNTNRVMESIESFDDETILQFDAALHDDVISEVVTARSMLLLTSGQVKNLAPTIRNIALFAKTEIHYIKVLNLRSKTWKATHYVESYARRHVCGAPNALETPEQAVQMIAAIHAIFAIIIKFTGEETYFGSENCKGIANRLLHKELEESKYDWRQGNSLHGAYELIDFFIAHPDDAERLSVFVSERGITDDDVLRQALSGSGALTVGIL